MAAAGSAGGCFFVWGRLETHEHLVVKGITVPETPRLRISIVFLVVANLIPVFGVLFLDWDVFYLLLLFWYENVIIGIFGILKMLFSGSDVFLSAFFTVHYGGFMFGHLMVLVGMFSGFEGGPDSPGPSEVLREVILNTGTLISIAALFISHGWSFVTNFLRTDERNQLSGNQAMAMPYKRMIITHIALLVGGFFLTEMGQPVVGLLLLMGMKIALDVVFHRREHSGLLI